MRINPRVIGCDAAPIAEAWSWVAPGANDVLDCGQAVPADPPAPALAAYLAGCVARGEAATYTEIFGLPPLREALAADIRARYGGDAAGEDVVITAGCNQAFCAVIDALCEAGDEVIVPLPCYFNHQMWLDIRGIRPRYVAFDPAHPQPTPAAVAELLGPRTRAIVLVTPNNPTGAIYAHACLAGIYRLAADAGVALIVDETYRDFVEGQPHTLFEQAQWREHFVHLYSFSKAFSLTGYRVGAAVCGPLLREALEKIQDCAVICAPHVSQLAALYGLRELGEWKTQAAGELMARAAAIREAFSEPALGYRLLCAGAYFAYVEHPFADQDARAVAQRLAGEHGLVTLPGTFFGNGQERYLRLAFSALPAARFGELVQRLCASQ